VPGDTLAIKLELLSRQLGEYKHPGITVPKRGSVGSRLIKVECDACSCIARMARKWIERDTPLPTCGCGYPMSLKE